MFVATIEPIGRLNSVQVIGERTAFVADNFSNLTKIDVYSSTQEIVGTNVASYANDFENQASV